MQMVSKEMLHLNQPGVPAISTASAARRQAAAGGGGGGATREGGGTRPDPDIKPLWTLLAEIMSGLRRVHESVKLDTRLCVSGYIPQCTAVTQLLSTPPLAPPLYHRRGSDHKQTQRVLGEPVGRSAANQGRESVVTKGQIFSFNKWKYICIFCLV